MSPHRTTRRARSRGPKSEQLLSHLKVCHSRQAGMMQRPSQPASTHYLDFSKPVDSQWRVVAAGQPETKKKSPRTALPQPRRALLGVNSTPMHARVSY
jgi:hypothetical protein